MATREQKSGKVFYGWWIVLVAGIGLSVGWAPILGFTLGVFLKSFSQEFSWSRAQISLAFTLSALGMTLAAPFLGWLVDRYGARRVILPATLLFGVGVLSHPPRPLPDDRDLGAGPSEGARLHRRAASHASTRSTKPAGSSSTR